MGPNDMSFGLLLLSNPTAPHSPLFRICSEGGLYGSKKTPPTRVWSEGGVIVVVDCT